MSYNKTNWADGSAPAISAANLNKIEQALYDDDANITSILTALAQLPTIQTGYKQVTAAANSYADEAVVFDTPFAATPTVIVSSRSTSTGVGSGNTSLAAINATKNGFTIRLFNADNTSRSPGVSWVAVLV